MRTINPWINFNGNAEEAFTFYKSVFGGEFAAVMRYGDVQGQEGCESMPDADKSKIMHIALPISDGHVLMDYADRAARMLEQEGQLLQTMRHQDDVGGLDHDVQPGGSDRNSHG